MILAAQGPHAVTVPLIVAQETVGHLLELPPLRDADDDEGLYWGASGVLRAANAQWGTVLYRSIDGGAIYSSLDSTGVATVVGKTTTALAAYDRPSWDLVNTVNVQITSGNLEAVDAITALSGVNLACIGGEIIRFCGARFDAATSTWVLSTLLRGLLGTDVSTSHGIGEDFTLLDLDTLNTIDYDGSCIGVPWKYAFLNGVGHIDLTMIGRRIMPNPASHARVTHDPSTGDAAIAWVPRRRLRYEMQDGIDPGVDEPVEDYSVDILFSGLPIRTISSWTAVVGVVGGRAGVDTGWRTVSYSLADQTADGLNGVDFEAVIYQLSDRVGRGVGCPVSSDDFLPVWAKAVIEPAAATDAPRSGADMIEAAIASASPTAAVAWTAALTEATAAVDAPDWRRQFIASLLASTSATAIVTATVAKTWDVGVSETGSARDVPS
jgi:hypothetical protein